MKVTDGPVGLGTSYIAKWKSALGPWRSRPSVAGIIAIPAATCPVLYGGALAGFQLINVTRRGRRSESSARADPNSLRAAAVRPAHHVCVRAAQSPACTAASHRPAHCRREIEEKRITIDADAQDAPWQLRGPSSTRSSRPTCPTAARCRPPPVTSPASCSPSTRSRAAGSRPGGGAGAFRYQR